MKVRDIVKIVNGELISGDPLLEIKPSCISTDSRALKAGDFFVALSGPNYDGNKFVKDAFEGGAIGALVTRYSDRTPCARTIVKVKDSLKAFQDIARFYRTQFPIPVIAVTGSNGKTTVKDMIAAVLSEKYRVLKSEGTKNNHIGVPQTILRLDRSHEICVLELGTNHRGEIRALGQIARPTHAVMTNIGPSHLEYFKDLPGVFEAKKEILETFLTSRRAKVFINGDDPYLSRIKNKRFKLVRYGLKEKNDLIGKIAAVEKSMIKFMIIDRSSSAHNLNKKAFELNLLGVHNIYNALAAIAVGRECEVPYKRMRKALSEFVPTYLRLNLKKANGVDIINDSYNSNPLSMKSAIETLAAYPAGSRWVVSADMMELGKKAVSFHKMIGKVIAGSGIDGLITFGSFSRHTLEQARKEGMDKKRLWHCKDHAEIVTLLRNVTRKGDAVLVKGSRSMRMEEIVKKMCAHEER